MLVCYILKLGKGYFMKNLFEDFRKMESVVIGKFDSGKINSILLNRYINLLNKIDNKEEVCEKKIMKIMLLINN